MSGRPIVDAHVHLWDPARLRYPWLAEVPALNRACLPADYAATAPEGVAQFVFVEAGAHADDALSEVQWVAAMAKHEPRIAGIVAYAPLELGRKVRPQLKALAKFPRVRGIRRMLQTERDAGFCLQPDFVAGVRLLPEFGFTFDLCVVHAQLQDTIELVRRCPEVRFVLDHLGKPAVRDRLLDPWREEMRQLAELPNACCKLSGLATEADLAAWKPADLQPYVEHAVECFGPDRVMYGSDWPVVNLAAEQRAWLETLEQLTAHRSEEEKRKLFGENAATFYRLPTPA